MGIPGIKNQAFTFTVCLTSQANTNVFQANPALAAGDVQVSIDGGAFNNLTALPTVSPAGSKQVKVSLTAAEMNGNVIGVLFSDQAGAEWMDLYVEILTDYATVGEAAGLAQKNWVIDNTVYNANGFMTSARIRLFPTAAAATAATDGGVGEGEFASFTVSGTAETSPVLATALGKVVKN